jgi:arylsulfatase A-like enzyme
MKETSGWTQSGQMRMIRKGDWKLTFDMQGAARLYDLRNDPHELVDLYGRPETADKGRVLLEDLLKWRLRVEDPLPLPRKRYVMKRDARGYWER